MKLRKNDVFSSEIIDITNLGFGVCKKDGQVVFVNGAVPGDVAEIKIIKVGSSYSVGRVEKFITLSDKRVEGRCDNALCRSCAYKCLSYEYEKQLKEESVRQIFKKAGLSDVKIASLVGSPAEKEYRNKAQYPVRRENGILNIGFYAKKSHRVIDGGDCLLQPREFTHITEIVRDWIHENNITVYSENTGIGLIRHIYLRKAFATGEIMVCIVANGKSLPESYKLLGKLKEIEGFKTLVLNVNRESTNVVLGKECVPIYGDGYIEDILCGVRVKISPLSFYQVNRDGAELLYKKAAEYAAPTGNEDILDLYCGAGTIGLSMADKVKSLVGVEIIPEAIEDAKVNASINNIDNARFICGDAEVAAAKLQEEGIKPQTVILDPPRKGCSEELLKTVAKINPEKIVYVSCDPATLARDCKRLLDLGYAVQEVTPVDMFPRTAHVETVCWLKKD